MKRISLLLAIASMGLGCVTPEENDGLDLAPETSATPEVRSVAGLEFSENSPERIAGTFRSGETLLHFEAAHRGGVVEVALLRSDRSQLLGARKEGQDTRMWVLGKPLMVPGGEAEAGQPAPGAEQLYQSLVEVPEYSLVPGLSAALRTAGIWGAGSRAANVIHQLAAEGVQSRASQSDSPDVELASQAAVSSRDVGAAFKNVIESLDLNHTYFCLNNQGTSNCKAITAYGFIGSSTSGGVEIPRTRYGKDKKQRCLANSRSSNSISVCGVLSNLYGINGVCHQHTNRGQMSPHGTFIEPGQLKGGWASFVAYGAYGIGWLPCQAASSTSCFFSSIF